MLLNLLRNTLRQRPKSLRWRNLKDKKAEKDLYTIENMVHILRWFCGTESNCSAIFQGFGRMLAFDAFVGAPDRHALNWGLVRSVKDRDSDLEFARLFDTARGLFRELSDEVLSERVVRATDDSYLKKYAENSAPIFGIGTSKKISHFDLIEYALMTYPKELASPICKFLKVIQVRNIEIMLQRRFRRIISQTRIQCIARLLDYRFKRLCTIRDQIEASS